MINSEFLHLVVHHKAKENSNVVLVLIQDGAGGIYKNGPAAHTDVHPG